MRKFFSFRALSVPGSENANSDTIDHKVEKVFWEKPWQNDAEDGGKGGCEAPEDSTVGPSILAKKREENGPGLKRSFSFSGERCMGYEGNLREVSGYRDTVGYHKDEPVCYRSLTPERPSMSKRYDLDAVWTQAFEIGNSPGSSKYYHSSPGNSPYSSPIPLRCRLARVKKFSNKKKVMDLYTDWEKREHKLNSKMTPNGDGCLVENKTIANSGRPPGAYSTAPPSPICNKENMRSYPFKDINDFDHHFSTQDWEKYDLRPSSPKKHSKRIPERLSSAFSGSRTNSQEYDSETTTVEDIYEDTNCAQVHSISDNMGHNCHLSDNLFHCKMARSYYMQDLLGKQREGCIDEDNTWFLKNEEEIDKELHMKLKEGKERVRVLSDADLVFDEHQNGNLCVPSLAQLIKDIDRDRRNLALELLTQLECRIAERSSAKMALKRAETELSTRTRRLEKEKQELQSCLEKELDRRSCDWSLKFEKFRAEEQRLRERVRELAEQNVSLQREVSSLNGREADTLDRIANLELQLNDLTGQLEIVKKENQNLHQALSELKERCDLAETDRDCIKRSHKMKEKENMELHKIVRRFQRICDENETTISALRKGLEEIAKQPKDSGDLIHTLQLEQLRLTGIEQALRRELESSMNETNLLRHENTSLLDRLQNATGCSGSSFRLDNELQSRMEYLQSQGLSLLYEITDLCGQLLNLVEGQQLKQGKEASLEFDCYSVVEYNMKFHSLKRGIENLKRSLQVISSALKEKSQNFEEHLSQDRGNSLSKQRKDHDSEGYIELELKAETLLTKILREKLLSKEMELEQLQGELASSLREHELLRSEIQRLQDELSSLTHKTKDMECQMVKKAQSFNQLEQDFKESLKELNLNRNLLPKVSKERDNLWEEVKQLKETDMLFKYEVKSLKNKIEALEEDILVKEGQISILKDSLDSK